MFDPTQLDPNQRKAIIDNMKRTRNNPIAMLKLHTLQQALPLKRWVEDNAKAQQAGFAVVFDAFQVQIERLFQEFETELLKKVDANANEK